MGPGSALLGISTVPSTVGLECLGVTALQIINTIKPTALRLELAARGFFPKKVCFHLNKRFMLATFQIVIKKKNRKCLI